MKKKIINVLYKKQNVYLFCLFLLFFPLKTQLQNGIIFIFDILFRNGTTSEVFTYNYTGTFIGCDKVAKMIQLNPDMNWFQKHGIYYLQFLPSLLAFWLVFKRWKKDIIFKFFDWFLVIISCFSILTAIKNTFSLLFYFDKLSSGQIIRLLITSVLFLSIGAFIFFRIFKFKERLQTLIFGLLGFYGSLFLWVHFLGPKILPVIP